jgi:hypothetical protein
VDGRLTGSERGVRRRATGRRTSPRTKGAVVTGPSDAGIAPDPDAAEDYADEVGVDPTQDEIDTYRRLEGEDADEPPPAIDSPAD